MSFLSAAFLFALPVAAAPVALHFLRRRQQQVISWGAMHFLTDAASEGRRFDRLEEWLLLALRTLALLALIFALAQPLVRPLVGGEASDREVVLVVDDSLSTDRKVNGEPVFDAIRQRTLELLDECAPGDQVRVMLAAEGPRWLTEGTSDADDRALRVAINDLEPTAGSADFLSSLRAAAAIEPEAEGADRQVIVVTDAQAHGWRAEASGAWRRLRSTLDESPHRVTLRVEPIGTADWDRQASNLAVSDVRASRQLIQLGEPNTFRATVTNTGGEASRVAKLVWSIDGRAKQTAAVPPLRRGATRSMQWTTKLEAGGVHEVVATIETPDTLGRDNEEGFVVEVVEALPILVATADGAEQEDAFLAAALGDDRDESEDESSGVDWSSPFVPKFIDARDLDADALEGMAALILGDVTPVTDGAIEALEAYVRGGGGLWVTLGSRIERERFNDRWVRGGAGLCPAPLAKLIRPTDRDSGEAMIHPPEGDHPATFMLADTERLDIDRVRLHRYHAFRIRPGDRLTPLLESGRGAPLALLHNVGRGRVIFQAFPLRTDWSDLVIAKAFVVQVQDWLAYLTRPAATRYNLAPREALEYRLTGETLPNEADVLLPGGGVEPLESVQRGGGRSYRTARTRLPGPYKLRLTTGGATRSVPFRVGRDPAESDLTPLSGVEIAALDSLAGVRFGTADADRTTTLIAGRPRLEPAWQALLLAMVAFMAAESLLATRLSRRRYGSVAASV